MRYDSPASQMINTGEQPEDGDRAMAVCSVYTVHLLCILTVLNAKKFWMSREMQRSGGSDTGKES